MEDGHPFDGPGRQDVAADPDARARRGWWRAVLRWAPLALLVAGGLLAFLLGLGGDMSLAEIIRGRGRLLAYVEARPVLTAGAYAGLYVLMVVFSVPGGSALTIIGGVLFGGIIGGLVTIVAATIASVIVFLVARTALDDRLLRRLEGIGPRATRLAEGIRRNAFPVIVFLRIVPVMPYWASSMVPALLGVGIGIYTGATLIGLLPWTVSFAFFGEALDDAIAAQEMANPGCVEAGRCEIAVSALASGEVLTGIAVAAIAMLPALWLWLRHRRHPAVGEAPDSGGGSGTQPM